MKKGYNECTVSVCMLTYNHEKYIRKSIDSVLMQKTDFTIEILVGDDCSTDSTADIIREYAEKYPKILVPFLREKNIGGPRNIYDLLNRAKGKYIQVLEGDDYWTDENKLKKQVQFLENHSDIMAVAHRVAVVNNREEFMWKTIPEKKIAANRFFSKEEVFKYQTRLCHTSSCMYRNYYLGANKDYKEREESFLRPGDVGKLLYLATKSPIYVMEDTMGVWRKVERNCGDNYTSQITKDFLCRLKINLELYTNLQKTLGDFYDFSEIINDFEKKILEELIFYNNNWEELNLFCKRIGLRKCLRHLKNIM